MTKTYIMCLHQEILNHCSDDVERFMSRLQQTAEAQSVLNQRRKKRSRKSKKKDNQDGDKRSSILSTNSSSHSFTKMAKKEYYPATVL